MSSPALAASSPKPADYTKTDGLSKSRFEKVEQVTERFMTGDGTGIYLEITKPTRKGRYPVILEASPYHGTLADREGRRILPDPEGKSGTALGLTGYFAPRGYAVAMMDLRGTGRSRGCLDHLGTSDRNDMAEVIEWLADQKWSNGRVGMTGHSYVGSTPSAAMAMRPKGLKTIVPSAGLASMYQHQFQAGVPFFLQWVGTMEAYEQLAIERKLPAFSDPTGLTQTGDDFGNHPEETPCGLPQSSLVAGEDQLSGRYSAWHAERDWERAAIRAPIPVFMVHGVNDNAARVDGMQWFTERGVKRFRRNGDKIWLGQWDHGSGCCPNRRGIQWTKALHAWFDRHLAQRKVDTGPPVEIFMADGTFDEVQTGARDEVMTKRAWPVNAKRLKLYPGADGTLSKSAPAEGETSFAGDPLGFQNNFAAGGATFATPPAKRDKVLAGVPSLNLSASMTMPRVYLLGTLFDVYDDPQRGHTVRRRISQCALQPQLRDGLDQISPIIPGERYDMHPPCFAIAHHLERGHQLVLRVTTSDPDKVPVFSVDPNITVFSGPGATSVTVPVARKAKLFRDSVRISSGKGAGGKKRGGPAQPGYQGATAPLAPGAGVRVGGVNSDYFEFDVKPGFDNARMVVKSTASAPADIDLYLHRRLPDGSWSEDLETGGTADLEIETLTAMDLEPGHYEIETHLYAGAPSTQVEVRITFFNSKDKPGSA